MPLKEKNRAEASARDEFEDAEIVELQDVPSTEPEQQLYLYPESESYRPDSVYTSIDGMRSIAVFLMVVRTVIVRFMYGANPLQKAFGGDWLPPIFLYASGARLVAEQESLKAAIAAAEGDPKLQRRIRAESAVKYYASTIVMIILAYLFVIASFGPSRACSWDVLVPLGVVNMIMYPINLRMKRGHWVMLIPALLLHIFYPVFFDLADGQSYFDRGTFAPNWTAAGVLGNLFLVGFCPVIGLLPFELTGMVMSHYMLEDKKATPQRKAALGFASMMVLMVGIELKYFGDQLKPTNDIVRKYIFCDYSSLPFSLSLVLTLSGCFGLQFSTLSIIFDPLGPTVASASSPRPRSTFVIRDFFRRSSLSAVSLYLFHAIVLNVAVRAASYVETSEGDTYMYFHALWPLSEWLGDLVLSLAGIAYFVFWELVLDVWFTRGRAIGTIEWLMGQGGNLAWALCSRCACCAPRTKAGTLAEDDETE